VFFSTFIETLSRIALKPLFRKGFDEILIFRGFA
jgi:hypothetical protein